jgi:ribosomal 30S subunit maturation factor RimM
MVSNFNTVHENSNILNDNILTYQNTLLTLTLQNSQAQQLLGEVSNILENRMENLSFITNYINWSINQSILKQESLIEMYQKIFDKIDLLLIRVDKTMMVFEK